MNMRTTHKGLRPGSCKRTKPDLARAGKAAKAHLVHIYHRLLPGRHPPKAQRTVSEALETVACCAREKQSRRKQARACAKNNRTHNRTHAACVRARKRGRAHTQPHAHAHLFWTAVAMRASVCRLRCMRASLRSFTMSPCSCPTSKKLLTHTQSITSQVIPRAVSNLQKQATTFIGLRLQLVFERHRFAAR